MGLQPAVLLKEQITVGERLFAEGQVDAAEALFCTMLEAAPGHTEVLNNLGVLRNSRGDTKAGVAYLRRALDADPSYGQAITNLVEIYRQCEWWADGVEVLVRYLEHVPSDDNAKACLTLFQSRCAPPSTAAVRVYRAHLDEVDVMEASETRPASSTLR